MHQATQDTALLGRGSALAWHPQGQGTKAPSDKQDSPKDAALGILPSGEKPSSPLCKQLLCSAAGQALSRGLKGLLCQVQSGILQAGSWDSLSIPLL